MVIEKGIEIIGSNARPMSTDVFYLDDKKPKTILIYLHGFNGFKDWGNFDLIAKEFAQAGFFFCKFNFSHNGTTPQQPEEFADLEAYGRNTYTKEIEDTRHIIHWFQRSDNPYCLNFDRSKIVLLGHSRGGGIALLTAWNQPEVKAVVTWASVSECKTPWGHWPQEKISAWRASGVQYYENKRTAQQMPLYFSLYEDYQHNIEALDIENACKKLHKPLLICHGTQDEAVHWRAAENIHSWCEGSTLFIIETDHVFGRKHPYTENDLPLACKQIVDKTTYFLLANNF